MRQNDKDNKLIQEIAAALSFRAYLEKVIGWTDTYVCFEPRPSKEKELSQHKKRLSFTELEEYINTHAEESTPVDFYIISHQSKPADVYPVQTKIFGMSLDHDKITDLFIKFLEEKNKSYAQTDTTLFIHFRNKGTLDFKTIQDWLSVNGTKFREIVVFTLDDKMNIKMSQLFPIAGDVITFEFEPKDYQY